MLRPANDRLDVEGALDELEQSSFIEVIADSEKQDFISVPLSAAVFGRKRLQVSPMKLSVEANMQLLLFFGSGQRTDLHQGIAPRIEKFFRRVALESSSDEDKFSHYLPILEYLSRRFPHGWFLLSQLYEERYGLVGSGEDALNAIRHFIEASEKEGDKRVGWQQLVRIAKAKADVVTELQGLMELSSLGGTAFEIISDTANRINNLGKTPEPQLAYDERKLLAEKILRLAESRLSEADATDMSRVAWIALGLGQEDKAKDFIRKGLLLDNNNEYCLRLAERLNYIATGNL